MAIGSYIFLVNALTYLRFGWDKQAAERGTWRVSEAELLFLAFIGGWPAAKFAQRNYRHKTRKQPFARKLNVICLLGILVLGSAFFAGLFCKEHALDFVWGVDTAILGTVDALTPDATTTKPVVSRGL